MTGFHELSCDGHNTRQTFSLKSEQLSVLACYEGQAGPDKELTSFQSSLPSIQQIQLPFLHFT